MVATCWGSAFSGFFFWKFISLRPCLQATIDPGMLVAHLLLVNFNPETLAKCWTPEVSMPLLWWSWSKRLRHLFRRHWQLLTSSGRCSVAKTWLATYNPKLKKSPVYTVSPMRSRCEPCIFPSYTRLCMLWSWQWWGWNLHGRRWKLLNHVTMCHYIGSSCWS